jgi:oligopeptide transport system substrate-binding protein
MTRALLLPTIFLAALFLAAYLVSTGGTPHTAGAITFINNGDVNSLDIHGSSWSQDLRIMSALWEGLIDHDPHTLVPIPGVAESWTISPDGLHYVFHFRHAAKWSNGDPVTANDFVQSWRRGMDPKFSKDYIALFFYIKNAEAYADGLDATDPAKHLDFSQVGVKATDPYTLEVTLGTPCHFFLDLCAFPTLFPLNLKSMAPFADDPNAARPDYNPRWTHPPGLVTNGPFRLERWVFQQYLLLKPNENYWDRAHVLCPAIKVVAFPDSDNAALLAIQSHEADAMSYLPASFAHQLIVQRDAGVRNDVHYRPVFGTYYYIFNCTQKPFDDPRVRKAFALAIDKKKIVDDVTKMHQPPLNVLVPPGYITGYHSPAGLDLDVKTAQQLLADAGYPGGKNFPSVRFVFNNASPHDDIAQAVAQMWQENLGVSISYQRLELKSFSAARKHMEFDIARAGWYGDYMDPTTWLDLFRSNNANNDTGWHNDAFDKRMAQSDIEPNDAKRFDLLRDAETQLITQDFPCIPLFQYCDGQIYDPAKIAGLGDNVRTLTMFKWMHRIDAGGGH